MQLSNESLGYLVSRLSLSLSKTFTSIFSESGVDLTKEQWVLLKVLIDNGPLTQTQITQLAHKDKTTITRVVDSLTKDKYVVRTVNPTDRRVHVIKLTDKAHEIMELLNPKLNNRISTSTNFMSEEELKTFLTNIIKIKENLDSML